MALYAFLQAKFFSRGRGGVKPRLIVIHTAETPETGGRARQIWRWFASKSSPQASAHYISDAHDIVQSVAESDTAWAVGDFGLNRASINFELSGLASQTPAEWADAYSQAELRLDAVKAAEVAKRYGIPIVKLTAPQILAGRSGFCGHWDITIAKKVYGGHTDPGRSFPWSAFLLMVAAERKKLG